MTAPRIAPYGSWRSPITSDWIVGETVLLGQPTLSVAMRISAGAPIRIGIRLTPTPRPT